MSSTFTRTEAHDGTEHGVTADLALATIEPKPIVGATPVAFVVPRDGSLKIIDPEALGDEPCRPRGTARPLTVEALIDYCREHNDTATEVWITPQKIVAVLNAQGVSKSFVGWGDYRAELLLQTSPQWDHWMRLDGKMVEQAAFAEHIEDGQDDIVAPPSAEMLEVVQHIQVARSANFRSSQHLHSGRIGFTYDETDQATAGKGKTFEIPEEFELGLPVYVGEEAYKVKVRFRYRLRDGALMLGYKIDRPDLIQLDAAKQIGERLRGESTATTMPFAAVYEGTPPEAVAAGRIG